MSQFAVDVRTVESVSPHPNADRLELATVDGLLYQMVVGKGEFTVGDPAIYFPLDAVLPEQLRMTLGLPRNRIKTVKLRGQISQGVLVPLHKLPALVPSGADLAGALGVTKYEPEECVGQGGARMTTLPAGLSVYDIENAERHKADWAALLASPHVVTEKLEGTNFCAHIDEDGVFRVCSRRHTVEEGDNVWWHVARKYNLPRVLHQMQGSTRNNIAIYGEVIGPKVQGNYYGRPSLELYVFDMKVNGQWLPWDALGYVIEVEYPDLTLVPVVALENDGRSHIHSALLREGVVVRALYDPRVVLKLKNKEYLCASTL